MNDATTEQPIQVAREAGILHIVLNRPERKNAINLMMYQMLGDTIAAVNDDPAVRVVLISGAGDCFTSGNDLGDFAKHRGEVGEDRPSAKFMAALLGCDKPVVAAVQGPAVGIGTTLLLHCDMVYAAESAYFQLPFVNLGLCPEFASSVVLPRLMGHCRAAELLYTGERFSAQAAKEVGIVNRVVADKDLLSTALERCQTLCKQPASALRATKQLLKQDFRAEAQGIIKRELAMFTRGLQSPEFKEAVNAFTEKREPDFSQFE